MVELIRTLPENLQKSIINEYVGKNVTPIGPIMSHMIKSRDRAIEDAYKDARKIMSQLTRDEFRRIQNIRPTWSWYKHFYLEWMVGEWRRFRLYLTSPHGFKGLMAEVWVCSSRRNQSEIPTRF